jgi:hypothetical protein
MADYYVNPSADVKQIDGTTAITRTSTVVNSGTAKGLYSNRSLLDNSGHGLRDNTKYGTVTYGGSAKSVAAAAWDDAYAATGVGSDVIGNTTYVKLSDVAHGVAVDDIVNITDTNSVMDGVYRVIVVDDADNFTINQIDVAGEGTVTYAKALGNYATMTAGAYIIRRVTTTVAGIANTVLRSGGTNPKYRRSIHKVETGFRHSGVATAIRAGYWDVYSGTFTTAPTETNNSVGDVAGNNSAPFNTKDHAANPTYAIPGELVYREGGKPTEGNGGVKQDDYQAKTS